MGFNAKEGLIQPYLIEHLKGFHTMDSKSSETKGTNVGRLAGRF